MAPVDYVQDKETIVEKVKGKAKANLDMVVKKLKIFQGHALVVVKEPQFKTVTISTAAGAIILAPVGGAFGTASGIVVGTAAGAIPALFTFGLSLPIGAFVGGGAGLVVGTTAGAGAGALGGGTVGFGGYKYRVEIKNGLVSIKKKALEARTSAKIAAGQAKHNTKAKVILFVNGVKQRGLAISQLTKETVKTERFKVTAATATAGAVAVGGLGAAVGTTAGAALGLIPAVFTFGLSIPVGAVVGGVVGTTAGAIRGGVEGTFFGYFGHKYKKEIREFGEKVKSKAKEQSNFAKSKLFRSKSDDSTGGTEAA